MEILFEDNHILVAVKPAGMLTQETDLEPESLTTLLKDFLKERDAKPGNVFLHAVHRLDRPVSGIVLFAKTSKALSRLNASMRERQTKKIYRARVEGVPSESGELKHYLIKKEHRAVVVSENTSGAKAAHLKYRMVGDEVEVELITGRYHQIRAQLSAMGCPILGDTKYGAHSPYSRPGIALRHCELTILHPVKKELQVFRC
jgi:23S rRNA pseudouridine1911/1915/1917 synthase